MRLTTGTSQYDMEIQEDGVFTDEQPVHPIEEHEIIPGPELQIGATKPEVLDERATIRRIIHGVTDIPSLPEVPHPGFWRRDEKGKPYNN